MALFPACCPIACRYTAVLFILKTPLLIPYFDVHSHTMFPKSCLHSLSLNLRLVSFLSPSIEVSVSTLSIKLVSSRSYDDLVCREI